MFSSFSIDDVSFIGEAILVGIGIILLVILIKRLLRWFFKYFDVTNRNNEKSIEQFFRSALNYGAIAFYVLYLFHPYIDVTSVLMGAGIIAIILGASLQNFVRDAFFGFVRLYEKQMVVGDYVTINGKYRGKIEEVRIRYVSLREWSGQLFLVSHSEIKEIQKLSTEKMTVIEQVVIGYQEDPKRAQRVLVEVCRNMNQEHKEWLQVDDDEPVQPFDFYGVTALHKDYVGVELTLIGCVKAEHYFEACNTLRKKVAEACYEKEIKLGEVTVFYQS